MKASNSSRVLACVLRSLLSVFAIVALFTARPASAQTVTIPDPGLESALRSALNIPSAPITVSNMLTLTNLNTGYWNIQDLTGLQTATNLLVLDLTYNPVTNFFPLTGAVQLAQLIIPYAGLQTLPGLSGVKSLRALNLNGNPFTNLTAVSGLTNLQQLEVNGIGQLTDLGGIQTVRALTNLDVSYDSITNLSPLSTLTNLWRLQAAGGNNKVTDSSPLANLTNLTVLDLSGNTLTNVTGMASLRKLRDLRIPYNRVTDFSSLANSTNLLLLDIGGNYYSPADRYATNVSIIAGMKQLRWLSFYNLRVQDLTPLATLTALTNLDMSWNYNPANPGVLNNLTNLTWLHCTTANLSNITFVSLMPKMQDFDCGINSVHDMSPLLGRTNLISLQAYYNGFITNAYIATNFHKTLQRLSYGGSSLSNVAFIGSLTNLQELWLDGNPDAPSISAVTNLSLLWHLNVNSDNFTNLSLISRLPGLTYLEMFQVSPTQNYAFLASLTNLNTIEIGYNRLGNLAPLSGMANLNYLYAENNQLSDLSSLVLFSNLNYTDLRGNLLDTNSTSAAWNAITNVQSRGTQVDYDPQNISPSIVIYQQPDMQCVTAGSMAYFAISAGTTNGTLFTQWQFNGSDLPGATDAVLVLSNVQSNQAGLYQAVLRDDRGGRASDPAQLYVGDIHCGKTVFITQQPANTVAAPGEEVDFNVTAMTTLTNLYYQWQFNGTNIDDATDSLLELDNVDTNYSGFYSVLVWDDSSLVVTSSLAQLAVVDVVSIPDLTLSNLVYTSLGISGGNPIYLTDLDNLNYLYAGYNDPPITNVAGLNYARHLSSLDLSGNPIDDPEDLAWLTSLYGLYLNNCGLQDADFVSGMTNLVYLQVNDNQIHSIPHMEGLTQLQEFQANRNGCLIDLPRLAVLTNLNNLSLHSTCLPDLAFITNMKLLSTLDAGGDWQYDEFRNTISDISPLTGKTNLQWLSLSWNQATNIPIIAPFVNLQYLYLTSNHFYNVYFITNMPLLGDLSVNFSTVTNISPLTNHYALYALDVSAISTTNLSPVAGLTNLNTLWAGGNHAGGNGSVLTALQNLQLLGYDGNNLTNGTVLNGMTNLYYCNLENNALTNISFATNKTRLDSLYLTGNRVTDLSLLGKLATTNMHWLSLSGNGFTNISVLTNLPTLIWLTMQSNHVSDITPLAKLTNLYYGLDISANEITNLSPVTNLVILTSIQTWQNQLKTLPSLASLQNITYLDFWGNQLTNVSGLSGMTQLQNVYLYRNSLTTIQPLSGLPSLRYMDFHDNLITNVAGLAGLPSLTSLSLNTNYLQDIAALTNLINLNYVDVRFNLLNTNVGSPAMSNIMTLQTHAYVDYDPQRSTPGSSVYIFSTAWLGGNQFQFGITSPVGSALRILTTTNFVNWSTGAVFTNYSGVTNVTDTAATGSRKFYRVLMQ